MARGVNTLIDDLDFYVETRDISGADLTIVATGTGTTNSATLQNTGPGAIFYVSFLSVQGTATVRVNVQAKDPVSGQFITFASLSIDGISTTNTVGGFPMQAIWISPNNTSLGYTGVTMFQVPMPRVFRVQASITATSSGATGVLSVNVGRTRLGGI